MPEYVKLGVTTKEGIIELGWDEQTELKENLTMNINVDGAQAEKIGKGDIIAPMTRLHWEDKMIMCVRMDEIDDESGQADKGIGDIIYIKTENVLAEAIIKEISEKYNQYAQVLTPGKTSYVYVEIKERIGFADCQNVLVINEHGSRLGTAIVCSYTE